MGKDAGRVVIYALIGMIVGAMVALHEAMPDEPHGPLAVELIAARLQSRVPHSVASCSRRSGFRCINTFFTAVYLMLILPALRRGSAAEEDADRGDVLRGTAAGRRQPDLELRHRDRQLVALVRGRAGLACVPDRDPQARVFPQRPDHRQAHRVAHAWELLVAMLVMEAAFGIGGVIAAPIYYAFIKDELEREGLI